jgi:hypothetical protein
MPGDDPTVFIDDETGHIALCSNNGGPMCGYLEDDMVTWKDGKAPEMLASYDNNRSAWHWFEAPWISKFNGV